MPLLSGVYDTFGCGAISQPAATSISGFPGWSPRKRTELARTVGGYQEPCPVHLRLQHDGINGLCCTTQLKDSCCETSMVLVAMSSWAPTTYKTKNWSHYNLTLKRRGSLSIWFDAEMAWAAKPSGHRGRQQAYSDVAIQTCLTIKVLFGLPLRQATGFVESLLALVGLDWAVPDFSTLCRRQRALSVAIPYRGSPGPLHLLVDSTGIKAPSRQHPTDAPAGQWRAKVPSRQIACNHLPGDKWNARKPLSHMQACTVGQWTRREPERETKRFDHQDIWGGHFGDS